MQYRYKRRETITTDEEERCINDKKEKFLFYIKKQVKNFKSVSMTIEKENGLSSINV